MRYPKLTEMVTSQSITDVFGGLDRNLRIDDGKMADMRNLTSDRYPLMATRGRRTLLRTLVEANGLIAKEKLAWVSKRNLFYDGVDVTDYLRGAGVVLTDSRKTMVSMGAYLIILPDKCYINTADFTDCGKIEADWTNDSAANISMCMADGTSYDCTVSASAPQSPVGGQYWLDTSGDADRMKVYSVDSWTDVETVYCRIVCPGIGKQFSENDGVEISGCTSEQINGSKILYSVSEDYVMLIGSVREAFSQEAGKLRIRRSMPDMDYVTECSNRIWGCKYGKAGEKTVNEIYCCALGDFKNWERYAGVSTDSYRASVGTDGPWTGAVTHLGYPLFFKEDHLHKVYVSASGAHEIVDTACRGVQAGCGASLCVVDERVYYKSREGVCVYDGSLPESIGYSLGTERYYDAVGGGINGKYYLSMGRGGSWELLVYDTRRGIWMLEDNIRAVYMARLSDELYLLDPDGNLIGLTGKGSGVPEERVQWSATTGIIGYLDTRQKYISRFVLRMKLEDGASAQVCIMYNSDGRWHPCGSINGNGLKSTVLPVRPVRCDHFQIRISGTGDMQLYSIAKIYEKGSDVCG